METIAISEFRANITKVLNNIRLGKKINITSRGRIIAKIVPPDDPVEDARKKLNEIGRTAEFDDLISPIETIW